MQKPALVFAAHFGLQAGVVRQSRIARGIQPRGRTFDFRPGQAVDDTALAAVPFEKRGELAPRIRLRLHGVANIGSIKTADETVRSAQVQALDDFLTRALISGCR